MNRFIAKDYSVISNAIKFLTGVAPTEKEPLEVIVQPYKKKRSISASNLSHVWYTDIARERGATPAQAKCYCKLHFGVPILRAQSETFRMMYDKGIRQNLSYEEKLKAMEILPVTSLMTTDQMCWYLKDMQMTMAQEENIILMSPIDSDYYEWSQQV